MYYTCEEVASKFNVKRRTIWGWIRSGKLPAIRLVGQYRVSEEDLQNFEKKGRKSVKGGESSV